MMPTKESTVNRLYDLAFNFCEQFLVEINYSHFYFIYWKKYQISDSIIAHGCHNKGSAPVFGRLM